MLSLFSNHVTKKNIFKSIAKYTTSFKYDTKTHIGDSYIDYNITTKQHTDLNTAKIYHTIDNTAENFTIKYTLPDYHHFITCDNCKHTCQMKLLPIHTSNYYLDSQELMVFGTINFEQPKSTSCLQIYNDAFLVNLHRNLKKIEVS